MSKALTHTHTYTYMPILKDDLYINGIESN